MSASMSSCCGGGAQHSASQPHPCKCDCAQCRAACCELECLVHPRFYCGQLLTDQDLSVMVDWIKSKTGLARHRDGWGVVCGLDVTCSSDKKPASVSITPGYAVTCCGDDVVVCKDASLDLASYCSGPDDCAPPRRQQPANAPRETVRLGGVEFDRDEIAAVDIYLQYAQKLVEPQVAIANRGCTASQYCEYGRVQEGHALCLRKVPDPWCTVPAPYEAWQSKYQETMRMLLQVREDALRLPQEAARRLREWLQKNPLYQFCHLVRILCEEYEHHFEQEPRRKAQETDQQYDERLQLHASALSRRLDELWFWVQQDWRNHFFRCACTGCQEDYGVPLARVWLRSYSPRPGQPKECHVVIIDPYPPYRRLLSRDCPPAPPGALNLSELIWQPREEACVALARYGIHVALIAPMSPSDKVPRLDEPPIVQLCDAGPRSQAYDRWLAIYTHKDVCGRERVVAFATWVDPRLVRLDVIDGIGPAKAKRLAERNIATVIDLARAQPEDVEAALQGLRGADDPAPMIKSAGDYLKDLMDKNHGFRP